MSRTTLDWIHGLALSNVRRADLGEDDWEFEFGPACVLRVSTLWRIVEAGRIAVTNRDDGHRFGLPSPVDSAAEALRILGSKIILSAIVDDDLGDLTMLFDQGARLELFNDSSGLETWEMAGPDGALVVACGCAGAAIWLPLA